MSLNRTALRLATVLALSNNATSPFPTIAEGRVFDSRLDATQIVENGQRQPYVIVYTDDDAGDSLSTNNGGPPWGRSIDLVLHLAVGAHGVLINEETGEELPTLGFGTLETDSELEGTLDLLEFQTERALFGMGTWPELFQGAIIRAREKKSMRFGDPRDVSVKYSERMVIYRLDVKDDWITNEEQATTTTGAAAALPPHIQDIVNAINGTTPGSAYVAQTVDAIEAFGLPAPVVLRKFLRMRVIEDERDDQDRRTNPRSQGDDPGVAQANLPDD